MTDAGVISRIWKCIAMMRNANAHEAAAAERRAWAMIRQYGVDPARFGFGDQHQAPPPAKEAQAAADFINWNHSRGEDSPWRVQQIGPDLWRSAIEPEQDWFPKERAHLDWTGAQLIEYAEYIGGWSRARWEAERACGRIGA